MNETTVAVAVFEGVDELELAGPWRALSAAGARVISVGPRLGLVTGASGLRLLPDRSADDPPEVDAVVVPGGPGTRKALFDSALIAWLRQAQCRALASVGTGAFLLAEAGRLQGRRVVTHWRFADTLRSRGGITVLKDQAVVQDGPVVTGAAGAGVAVGLAVVDTLMGPTVAAGLERELGLVS